MFAKGVFNKIRDTSDGHSNIGVVERIALVSIGNYRRNVFLTQQIDSFVDVVVPVKTFVIKKDQAANVVYVVEVEFADRNGLEAEYFNIVG